MKANLITLAVLMVCLTMATTAALRSGRVHWTSAEIAGAAIAAVGLLMLILARLQLGASFSVEARAKRLVTTGLYSKIRNPIYVAGEVFLVGVTLATGKWMVLVLAMALVPVQVLRARKEERVLAEAFGEEYARYKAGTWF